MSEDTRRLTRCLTFIKENTSQVEKILDRLIEDDVIGMDERSQILTSQILDNQIHSIIETVIRKQAHESFIRALNKTGNSHVVDKLMNVQFAKGLNTEKTFIIEKADTENGEEEKAQQELLVKEKTLEELKMENDRLKTQQSKVREMLNMKHKKIQELKLQIVNYKKENEDMSEQIKSFEDLQFRMQDIETVLEGKDTMNKMIEMALSEKSEEIFHLQQECEDLKIENQEKSEQISYLNEQMEALKVELQTASKDRERLEEKVTDMSSTMNEKFKDMMNSLDDLKTYRQAQCEVGTPQHVNARLNSNKRRHQCGSYKEIRTVAAGLYGKAKK